MAALPGGEYSQNDATGVEIGDTPIGREKPTASGTYGG
jgi:hypothetical protein